EIPHATTVEKPDRFPESSESSQRQQRPDHLEHLPQREVLGVNDDEIDALLLADLFLEAVTLSLRCHFTLRERPGSNIVLRPIELECHPVNRIVPIELQPFSRRGVYKEFRPGPILTL